MNKMINYSAKDLNIQKVLKIKYTLNSKMKLYRKKINTSYPTKDTSKNLKIIKIRKSQKTN